MLHRSYPKIAINAWKVSSSDFGHEHALAWASDERRTIPYPCALKPHLHLWPSTAVSQRRTTLVNDETLDNVARKDVRTRVECAWEKDGVH